MEKITARKLLRAALLCLALQFIVACGKNETAPPPGIAYESKEGKFAIVFPDSFPPPELSAKQVTTEVGDITMHLFTSSKSDGSAFIISYNDYPDTAFVKETAKMMDDIRDGALGNMDAKLESQKDFAFEGHPARTLNFSLTSEGHNGYGRLQYFIVRPRLYQIIFLALDNQYERDADVINRTFSSFKLLR
jgi:hypothetical protein